MVTSMTNISSSSNIDPSVTASPKESPENGPMITAQTSPEMTVSQETTVEGSPAGTESVVHSPGVMQSLSASVEAGPKNTS